MSSIRIPETTGPAAAAAIALLLALGAQQAGAADSPAEREAVPATACPGLTARPAPPPAPDRSAEPIVVYAEKLEATPGEQGEARGQVELTRGDQHLATERILYNPVTGVLTIPGAVSYRDQQVWINGQSAEYSFPEESGRFSVIQYGLTGSSANGSAESGELIGGRTALLHGLEYTTCPGERPDWEIQARKLVLDFDEGTGSARGARLRFKGVPILYAPWFTFPIDDRRKSGFLYPTLGHSSDLGLEVGAPWYWNIAPNQDATLEPRWFSKRGFMLSGNYRFLTQRMNGSADFDYMPDDRVADRERHHYTLKHYSAPFERWSTAIVVDRVSDDRYFQDFGSSLAQTARQFMHSSATVRGVGRYWSFEFLADDFQVIDDSVLPENEPYKRVPRLAYWLDRPLGNSNLHLALDSELVWFERDTGVTGARLDLAPRLYWDRYHNWGFFKPSLGFRYTGYSLNRNGVPGDESPSRGNPIASLDAGLVFDRGTAGGGLQTLEPRLFYLYVPFEKQDSLPMFDTGEYTFGFSQLFNTSRFAGGDRQSDANQLSLAVTTRRYANTTGQALWSLSLGQIVYFTDQRVQIDGRPQTSDDVSPFLAEFDWTVSPRLRAVAGLQWDWEQSRTDLGLLGLHYRGDKGGRVAFEYRFRRDRVNQFDFRIFWPISKRWRMLSRVNYSFDDSDLLELQGGVEYESCCWAVRTVVRRYLRNRDGDFRNGIFLEVNLKGLASVGTRAHQLFGN